LRASRKLSGEDRFSWRGRSLLRKEIVGDRARARIVRDYGCVDSSSSVPCGFDEGVIDCTEGW
jgi:hypothetical protein